MLVFGLVGLFRFDRLFSLYFSQLGGFKAVQSSGVFRLWDGPVVAATCGRVACDSGTAVDVWRDFPGGHEWPVVSGLVLADVELFAGRCVDG